MSASVFSRSLLAFTATLCLLVAASGQAAAESPAAGAPQVGEADVVYTNGLISKQSSRYSPATAP